MTPVWIIVVAAVVASTAGARASRPAHVFTSAHDAVPLLRRWAPPEQGATAAWHVQRRASSVARAHPGAEACLREAIDRAFAVATESDAVAAGEYGPPAHPFRALQGTLPSPVSGVVVVRFGPRPRADLATWERHTGWSWVVAPEATVRVVADGIVVAVRELVGLGVVVVIDHGDQYHTVYAGLGEAWTDEGGRVVAGDIVGVAIGGPGRAGELYFEVRDQGVPVDPGQWLR